MDVRCEKCGTDYELDDARVKPAGVNVQCTSCGHVFRVRRHPVTTMGVGGQEQRPHRRPDTVPDQPPLIDEDNLPAAAPSDTIPIPTLDIGDEPSGPTSSRPLRMTPSSARARARGGKERNWLVRLPGGEIETCRELATLHQWIIWGKVTRNSGISRSGKTWKRLGDIKELESFFEVAEESRRARRRALGKDDGPDTGDALELPLQPASRVIGPIPDSFSSSGPVSAEASAGASGAWPAAAAAGAPGAGASRASSSPLQPSPPVLPAGATAADIKRTLRGVTSPSRAPSAPPAFGSDEDEGPTQEVDPALPLAQGQALRWAGAGALGEDPDEHAGPDEEDDSTDVSIDVSVDMGMPGELEDLAGEDAYGEPGEPLANPLDARLPARAGHADPGGDPSPDQASATGSMKATIRGMGDEPTIKTPVLTRPGSAAHDASQDDEGEEPARSAAEVDEAGASWRPLQSADVGADPFDGPRRFDRSGLARLAAQEGAQGPSAGMARRSALHDVAFAGGKIRPLPEDGEPSDDPRAASLDTRDSDTQEVMPSSSRVGRWIVLAALILMAASAAVVYKLVFRPTGETVDVIGPGDGDAGAGALLAGLDGGVPGEQPGEQPDERTEAALALAQARLAADTRSGLEPLDGQLAAAGDKDAAVLAARARVHTALAQQLLDRAALASGERETLERDAKKLVLEAHTLAQRALQLDRTRPDALVAMADVQRLQGQRPRQVESYLEDAFEKAPDHREARLVRAMTMAASERDRGKAREIFEALARTAGSDEHDVRPIFRLALLDLAESRPDDARRRAQEVLAAQPSHEGALALIARLDATPAVDTSDPMPPEETPADGPGDERGKPGKDDDDDGRDSFDSLVSRAASKAKSGKCGDAIELYERALDINPSGVAALLGMADCHLERKEFASAHGKFQAVLGVSPSNAEALFGMAEAYRKQGLDTQAVSWYRKYIEEHPSGSRASKARQRIDELEGGSQSPPANPSNGSGGSGGSGGGAGSGSGGGSGGGSGSGDAPAEPTPPAGSEGTASSAGQESAATGSGSP